MEFGSFHAEEDGEHIVVGFVDISNIVAMQEAFSLEHNH